MIKLHTTLRSPYARKIYVMALEKGLKDKIEFVIEDLSNKSTTLLKLNPLGTVPTLITTSGEAIFDSTVIAEYIDSLNSTPTLIPTELKSRLYSLKISSIGDGMSENAVVIFMEKNKSAELQDKAKLQKSTDNLERSLAFCEAELERFTASLTIAPISIASALGYVNFRLKDSDWETRYPELAKWFATFNMREHMVSTVPTM